MTQSAKTRNAVLLALALLGTAGAVVVRSATTPAHAAASAAPRAPACAPGNAGLSLPPGFCATVFADGVGHARQMAVAQDGTLYLNTWSGSYYRKDQPRQGGFLMAFRDTKNTGHADVVERFGPGVADGSTGGTGVALHDGYLYAEVGDKIIRYRMTPGKMLPDSAGEVLLSGLPVTGEHPMHQFLIDAKENMFVNVGALSNACEHKLGEPLSPGYDPCTELETRGGIWRYSAVKPGQVFSPAERYVTGIRNIGGMRFDSLGRMLVTQHGRDRLPQSFKALYTMEHGVELPAEELLVVKAGGDYGWPKCYFDGFQKKLVLAPEYGGDGTKVGDCGAKLGPLAFYPAHWAPNDLLLYSGSSFPAPYRGGAFIAFHGSWNRAPTVQEGYKIVFQPMAGGKPSAAYRVFADGFAGKDKPDNNTAYRPSGLATAPDGSLYVSDDTQGRIWKISYVGPKGVTKLAEAPPPVYAAGGERRDISALAMAPGATREQVALGDRIFHGEAKGGTCSGCHGVNGVGGAFGSDLTRGAWLWSDGSLAGLSKTIATGVTAPKEHTGAMPPLGGADLTKDDLAAVSAYVWAIGHKAN